MIDVSTVPLDKQKDVRFLNLLATLQVLCANPQYITARYVHEAAHAIYLERAGAVGVKLRGAQIVYDSKLDRFDHTGASVKGTGYNGQYGTDHFAWVIAMAKTHVAGGIAVRKLIAVLDPGDDDDRKHFELFCDAICKSSGRTLDRPAIWKAAQDAVEKDLRKPDFRKKIWAKVAEFRLLRLL
jgi:hypothetical protein